VKWKISQKFQKKQVQQNDDSMFYDYFEFESCPYVLDKEMKVLYKILENSFKIIISSSVYSSVLNEGVVITGYTPLKKVSFNYVPAHTSTVRSLPRMFVLIHIHFYMPH